MAGYLTGKRGADVHRYTIMGSHAVIKSTQTQQYTAVNVHVPVDVVCDVRLSWH